MSNRRNIRIHNFKDLKKSICLSPPIKFLISPVTNISEFKSKLRILQQSIDIISPIFKDIENLNQILDRPQQEIDSFIDQLKRADVLVAKCMKVKYWNFYRKSLLWEKLDEQEVSFLRFFQIDVQFDQDGDMIKILKTVTDVHKRSLDQVDESKKMVIKDTVVDDCSVIAVSAGGCGKTKGIMSMKDSERLKIPFEKIDAATEKFKMCIGKGGYGWVYKGILSINGIEITVAVKRLNERFGQGLKEFLTEIQSLSGQEHPNLISLVGYCDEGNEKILVYEYAERGSLDRYIRRNRDATSTTLTWLQRLKICADAARGLNHLHNHIGGHRTIIHRDIKSSNILIDENWVAKISDLGLSKLSVTGFGMSGIVSNGVGTHGYGEPEYFTSGVVTKKSDVYSFGIVLFEVLCGRLCITEYDDGFILSGNSVKEYYNKGNWVKIVDPSLRERLGSYSMTKFSEIAYRCLHDVREQRPAMDIVAKELEEILNVQVAVAHELEEKRKHQVVKDSDSDEIQVTIECILDLSN